MKKNAVNQDNNEVIFNTMLRSARNQKGCAFRPFNTLWRILLRPINLNLEDIPDMVVTCFVLHSFCKERNIEPILADMDKVIVMERLNAPTKDIVYMCKMQAGGAIRDAIIRYFVEYL